MGIAGSTVFKKVISVWVLFSVSFHCMAEQAQQLFNTLKPALYQIRLN